MDRKAIVQIQCNRVIPGVATKERLVSCSKPTYGEIKRTGAGNLLSGQFPADPLREFSITGLEPDTEYEFSGVVVGENGISKKFTSPGIYRTAKAPDKAEFQGPISIEIQPEKIVLSWGWVNVPASSQVMLRLNGGPDNDGNDIYFNVKQASGAEHRYSSEIRMADLSRALKPATGQVANEGGASKVRPLFVVTMTGQDGKSIKQEFEMAFLIQNPDAGTKKSVWSAVNQAAENVAPQIGDKKIKQLLNLIATIFVAF